MSLLDVSGLTIRTGERELVSDLGFTVGPGERLGLIGESGSGKSLTAMAVMGLLPGAIAVSGSIRLAREEVVGAPERLLRGLRGRVAAVVFQEPLTALDPLMRLGKQVEEAIRLRAARDGTQPARVEIRGEVLSLLARVALPDPGRIARAFPHEISGGQRQRVAIAMALACRPQLLIADEPTTALDVTTQAGILTLLEQLVAEEGMALLFISHDLPVVARVAERVVVLEKGRAVETGPVGQVFAAPAHPYTQRLIAAARRFDRALKGEGTA